MIENIGNIVTKVFGSKHEKDVKRLRPIVEEINQYYERFHNLTDEELRNKTQYFKDKITQATQEVREELQKLKELLHSDIGSSNDTDGQTDQPETDEEQQAETLRGKIEKLEKEELEIINEVFDEILPEAFAVVKQTCKRLVGKKVEGL